MAVLFARSKLVLLALLLLPGTAAFADPEPQSWPAACEVSLTGDFTLRDKVQPIPREKNDRFRAFGPNTPRYEPSASPPGCDTELWQERRVLAAVEKIISMDLNYCHHTFPGWDRPASMRNGNWCNKNGRGWRGLDCSNFTSWAYNYGIGKFFTPVVRAQAVGRKAPGYRIAGIAKRTITGREHLLRSGDLLFFTNKKGSRLTHVAIWTGARVGIDFDKSRLTPYWQKRAKDGDYVIADSIGIGPGYRVFRGWYKRKFSHARHVIADRLP